MWFAALMICTSLGCFILDDTRGPYKTEDKCLIRLLEMHMEAPDYLQAMGYFGYQVNEGDCSYDETKRA